ncbi:MBL fold metallo-hydrolase [Microvirga sp. W0021]|uniref:MBL fold metallo-hydrolase n=1 Tax=Hohaiivirga grylli TaxID=3133970 RepID=A0ABV0BFB6_9HYPH
MRGSFCACGEEFNEFGGNTPCVEIRVGDRLFIIDAGTGFPVFGREASSSVPQNVDLLLSHLHSDHIGGLLLCKHLLTKEGRTFNTYCGNLNGETAEAALNQLYSPPIFPVKMDCIPTKFNHTGFHAGENLVFDDGITVKTVPLKHPGGATGYRFDHEGRSICYLSDLEHSDHWPDQELVTFCQNTDLIIFDGMFCKNDYSGHEGWGHSTWSKGIELCRAANAASLALFHLNPCYDDQRLHEIERTMQKEMPEAFIARERHHVYLEPR